VGGFQVEVPVVDALSLRVAVAASDVRSALGSMKATACVDTGDPALSGALSSFQSLWQSFTEHAAQSVDSTASSMSAAANAYRVVDTHVMVNPALASAFMHATATGDGGTAQMLLGPLLPGTGTP
jgi:hypothetical protein